MLLEFSISNYLSFKDKKTLSLEATSITDYPENVVKVGDFEVLKSTVIYGANSSGKSNLIKALIKMRSIITQSASKTSADKIGITRFLLSTETDGLPSAFEVLFILSGIRYRYGFEVDDEIVHSEWLFECNGKKEIELFTRIKDNLDVSDAFPEGKGLEERTRDNALFLSITDQFNGAVSKKIMGWFNNYYIMSGIDHVDNRGMTINLLKEPGFMKSLLDFINNFNLGFNKLELAEDTTVKTFHNKYDENREFIEYVEFSLLREESSGTNKLFDMIGYIWASLYVGRIVLIDELDAKLHPLITRTIVRLFNEINSNPHNAQLIFATHDTNLLSYGGFRRDQIYFTEKDQYEATDLYSLIEYKDENNGKVRKDRSFEKDYINGRYGGVPFIGDFSKLFVNG